MPTDTLPRTAKPPERPPDGAELLTCENVAWLLQCSRKTVVEMAAARLIPTVPLPGTGRQRKSRLLRFSRRAIEDWIARGCPPPGK